MPIDEINLGLVAGLSQETQIALLRRDLDRLGPMYDKLIEALSKVTEVSSNIKQLVAVQEEKIVNNNRDIIDVKKGIMTITNRINKLENWKWWVLGVAVTIGIMIGGGASEIIRFIH